MPETNTVVTRPEFDALRGDVKRVEADVVEIRTLQSVQQTSLTGIEKTQDAILNKLNALGSRREMIIAGASGLGGGIAAGVVYVLHWMMP
ncbi:hypothetical protein [Acetobacter estunensis]|uniref:hypothetical protein n=1 Tax=Acetobacter estunensis TaxID=104097 RepID=UPI001C2DE21A|nr:hypothetical protein [Acetobacter estunensis]MBV1835668.1 hypothetical protein [Acetobacter estunensis]MBV1836071.1 hypothetical protein [Acetobacter estunensis]